MANTGPAGLQCIDCKQVINTRNSHTTSRFTNRPRCGKCYLAWKREVRAKKGML